MTSATRVWSLWDMLKRFETRRVLGAWNYVSQTDRKLRSDAEEMRAAPPGSYINLDTGQQLKHLLSAFNNLRAAAHEYAIAGLRAAVEEAQRIVDDLDCSHLELDEVIRLQTSLAGISATAIYVLSDAAIYVLTHGSAYYVEGEGTSFGDRVADAFPSAVIDIREASKCRGLERWTACVMHCMRALEPALLAFASGVLGKPPKKENWHEVLKEIETKIEAEKKAGKHSALQFESTAATYFRDVKDGWRNYTMHAKQSFDEEEAVAAYDATRSLMRHLSKRFSEPGSA